MWARGGPASRPNAQAALKWATLSDRDPTFWVKMSSMSQSRNARLSVDRLICAVNGACRRDWQVGI